MFSADNNRRRFVLPKFQSSATDGDIDFFSNGFDFERSIAARFSVIGVELGRTSGRTGIASVSRNNSAGRKQPTGEKTPNEPTTRFLPCEKVVTRPRGSDQRAEVTKALPGASPKRNRRSALLLSRHRCQAKRKSPERTYKESLRVSVDASVQPGKQ